MPFVRWIAAGMLFLACLFPFALHALAGLNRGGNDEQRLKSLSLEQLGNIEVTALNKQPEEVWKTPAAIYVLTQEDIRRSGATTLPELLRMIPGAQVSRMQSDQWAVGIRGFANQFSKGLLVLIDGRSVYTPLFEGVYWDVQDLAFEDIDHIEVIRGPGGTIWGPNAVNGVINIVTKKAAGTQGVLTSTQGGGEVDRFIGVVRAGFSPIKNLQFRIYAKGFNRGPELNPGDDPYDHWHQERGGFRADWRPNATSRWDFQGDLYQGKSGAQTAIGEFFPPSQIVSDQPEAVSGGYFMTRWSRQLSKSNFYLQAYLDRTNRRTSQFTETRTTVDLDFIDHITWLPRQDLIAGAGVRESPSYLIQTQATVNFEPHRQNDYIYTGFLQDTFAILPDRLMLTLGSKYENNNFSGSGLEPSARLLWNPERHLAFWGSVSRALRIPGRVDQDLTLIGNAAANPPLFVAITGNPKFKPEVLIGWEAGYRQLLAKTFYVDLAAFHNQYDRLEGYGDIAVTVPTQPYPYTSVNVPYANAVRGVSDGFEIAPDWRVASRWELRGSYSHLHLGLHSMPGFSDASNVASYEGSSPDRQAFAQSILDLPYGLEVNADYRYVSALPAQDVSSYQTADGRLAWSLGKRCEIQAVGRNLLQPAHREFAGDNGNPVGIRRTVFGGLLWTP